MDDAAAPVHSAAANSGAVARPRAIVRRWQYTGAAERLAGCPGGSEFGYFKATCRQRKKREEKLITLQFSHASSSHTNTLIVGRVA